MRQSGAAEDRCHGRVLGRPRDLDLEIIKTRFKVLEARAAQEGILLTEDQMAALEKAAQKKAAHGEIESHHPGDLCSQCPSRSQRRKRRCPSDQV